MTERKSKATSGHLEHPDDEESRSISKSLVRGLAILACFTPDEPLLGISDIAEKLGSSRSTTHRYACTLVELGYLEQDSRRRYHLGLRAADIGIAVLGSMELRKRSRPCLEQLRDGTTHTASLAILGRTDVLVIEWLPGHRSTLEQLEQPVGEGSRLPAHCTASGKLLLALANPTGPLQLPRELKLTRRGPRSITNKRALYSELEQIRETTVAHEDEELSAGMRSLATPAHDPQGEVIAAVALSVPSSIYSASELQETFTVPLRECAERISAEAGCAVGNPELRSLSEPVALRSISKHVARRSL
jgi:IclR family transcriptional regulator, pca regulon regulatory protein